MHRKRIEKGYSLVITLMIILSPLTSIYLWDGLKSVAAENPLTPVTTITGLNNDDNFGWNVSWIGDVNGDGFDDIIVGAPYTDSYSGGGNWWDNAWSYRRKLIFDNSGQSQDLENFPVLVNLSSSNFDYSKAKLDGTDLRFIDADGSTQLKYHIEDWNSSGYSYIWVNVTSIDGASSTDYIWMYYGNPAASDIQDVSGTYDTNFLAVWHLNETGTGTRYDSTSNDYDGTPENYDGDEATTGKIDGADDFNQNHDIINVSTMNPQSYDNFTIEAWYKSNMDTGTDDGYMFDHGIDESVNPEIEMGFSDDAGHEDRLVLKILDNGVNANRYYGTSDIVDQQFHHLVAIRDDGRIKLYVDGVMETNDTDDDAGETISIDTAMGPYIGDFVSTSEFINGILDEVRVSGKARSADWVKAQYLSMNNSFISYGAEETKDWWDNAWLYRRKLTFDNSGQSEDLENFPVLINLSSSNFNYLKAKSDGTDLRFIDADGSTQLKYHIEKWNKTGSSYIWVNVTSIAGASSNDYIWMYYGNSAALDVQDVSGTYDANYVGIWHLNETTGNAKDSTSNQNNGTESGGVTFNSSGKIDGAMTFDGLDDAINVTDDPSIEPPNITVSLWFKRNGDQEDWAKVLCKGDPGPAPYGSYKFEFNDLDETDLLWQIGFTDNTASDISLTPINDNQWHYVVGTYDGTQRGYLDGIEQSSISLSKDIKYDDVSLGIGADFFPWDFFNGTIDEVHISKVARSADWIKAQYLSMNNSFISYAGEESLSEDCGAAYIFFGYPGIILNNINATNADVTINGSNAGDLFGWSVADAGDVNNDDYDDIIIGAPGWGADKGRAYIFHGRTTSSWSASYDADADADMILTGENDGDKFGFSVSGAGDMNNDGLSGEFYKGWSYRKKITVHSSKVEDDLTNFPMLIHITDSDLKDKAQSDGDDIMFIALDNETKLDHEIDKYNSATGELIAWVKIPSLSSTVDTVIYMYYNNSDADNQQNPEEVWSNNYRGVWHLDETSGYAKDFTSYGTNGTVIGTVTQGSTGQIYGAYEFDGSDGNVNMGDPGDGHLDFGTGSFTLSLWVYDYTYTSYQYYIFKGSDSDSNAGYSLYQRANDGLACFSVNDDLGINRDKNDFNFDSNTWTHIVGVANRTDDKLYVYVDGVETGTAVDITVGNVDSSFFLQVSRSGNEANGLLDEVHISSGIRSPGWIKTEYNNQKDPISFYSVNDEEITPKYWLYRKPITINASQVTGDLTDFPVIISISDSDLKSKARPDGYDIIFTKLDGRTKLDHEIESYNSGTGELVAWIKIPSLSSSSDTVIYMHYGNPNSDDQSNPTDVWDINYTAIWHLNETGAGNADEFKDSTSYANHGQGGGGTGSEVPKRVTGKIGNGQEFDETDDNIDCGNDSSLDLQDPLTLEAWIYPTGWGEGTYGTIVARGAGGWIGYQFFTQQISEDVHIWDGESSIGSGTKSITLNTWQHVVVVIDSGGNVQFYVNGSAANSGSYSIDTSGSNTCYIGSIDGSSETFNGTIDEVRVSNVVRSANWISTEYNNQNDPSTFYTLGDEESNINYDDIIVGAYGYAGERGRAYVFFGESGFTGEISAGNADVIINGTAPNDRFGWDVSRAGDVNNDGFADIIIGAPGNNSNAGAAYIFYGNNSMLSPIDANDADRIMIGSGGEELGFSVSYAMDVNNDGYDDVIIGAPGYNFNQGRAYIFCNNGLNDIVIANSDDDTVSIYNGTSTGWEAESNLGVGVEPRCVFINDANNDGYNDIITADWGDETVSIYNGTSSGGWESRYTLSAPGSPWVVVVGDVNNDGLNDIVVNDYDHDKVTIYNGTSSGLWDPIFQLSVGDYPRCVTIGDANNDGYNDILTVDQLDNTVTIYNGTSGGDWDPKINLSIGNYPRWVCVGDANNDGYNDVVTANSNDDSVTIYNGTTSGNWESICTLIVGNDPRCVFIGDANNDGYNDILASNYADDTVTIYNGTNNNGWEVKGNLGVGNGPMSVFVGDANNDGYNDILTADYWGDNTVTIYNGTSDGFWEAKYTLNTGVYPHSVFVGNANNDGLGGSINANNANLILTGVSTGDKFGFSVGSAGDLNMDGFLDIIVGAPFYDDVAKTDAGAIYVFEGGPSMNSTVDWSYKGEYANDHLGWSVSFAGNVNGDGLTYLITGAPNNDDGGVDAGKVYLLTIMPTKPVITNILATPSTQNIDGYVNITCDVAALSGVDSVWVNITLPGGGFTNVSLIQGIGNQWYYNNDYTTPGLYQYVIWANDTNGNWTESNIYFFEVINGLPSLSFPQVNPMAGYSDTAFNFTVIYTDMDNHPPDNITVNITGIGFYDLIEFDPSDTNYTDGKTYYYNLSGFAVGSYSFHFAANDTIGDWTETGILLFDVLESGPTISLEQVNPTKGYIDTRFNFTVTYIHPDNQPPYNITVNITGVGIYNLIEVDPLDTDYSDGKDYYYNASGFNVGQYSFHFAANDTNGNWNESSILMFEVINREPLLSLEQVIPTTGYIDTYFNFTVSYSDPDNHAPYNITVNITGVGIYDLIEFDTLDTNFSDGKEYYYNMSGFVLGSYTFHFAANDTIGNWTESGILQFDVIDRGPMLSLEQVDPPTGYIDTWFNFSVTYTDLDNHAPDLISVNITGIGIYYLVEVDILDTDYNDGKAYYYNFSGLAIGSYTFHFAANDTFGNWTETSILQFDVVNRVPILISGQVNPSVGDIDTAFNFTVIYTDLDNNAPGMITVNITGIGVYDLIELDPSDTTYTDGKAYYYNTSGLAIGSYTFHFAANDTFGNWIESGTLQFDVINRGPMLSLEQVDPATGYIDTWFNFTVAYTDLDNHALDIITVNITGVGVYDLIEVDVSDTDYTDGKEYYCNASGFALGQYSFHFAANDTFSNWTESGILQFDVINRVPVLTSGQVNPTVGDIDSRYNFSVIYTDLDNHPPNIITMNITGIGVYDLIALDPLDMDYTDGKVYYYNASGFSIGSYSFNFAANDTQGDWIETIILNFDVIDRVPTLLFGQVDPTTGYTDTWFNYTLTYVDLDNHAPYIITVNITGIGIFDLFALDPLDMDYTDGKVYYYNLSGFAVGSYSFHFAANDTFGNWIETGTLPFDVINRAPILSFGQVDPAIGYTDTWFNFTVNYTDLDNHAPLNITLNLTGPAGGIFDLLEVDPTDSDYTDGKEYYFNTTLTSGLYSFHFAANDSIGLWAIETMEINAPDVVPKHGVLGVVDCVEEYSDQIHLNATLFDDYNDPIPYENVAFYIDINKNGTYEAGEFAGIDSTLANGSVSVIYTSNLSVGTYYFTAVYVGSGDFVIVDDEALLTILAKAARLTATNGVVDEGDDIYLTAVLIDNESDPIGNEQVAFYIDKNKNGFYEGGEFIGLTTTSSSGVASVGYSVNLIPETYGILARYLGSTNYAVNEIEGSLLVQNIGNIPPTITGIVPNQIKPEDSLPWALDLTFYEADAEDSDPELRWYLTGVDTSLYSVTGMNSSDDVFTFIPVPDAFGNDEVILWLVDSSGDKVSQVLWVNITPVNDPPYFAPFPPNLYVHYDDPSTDEDDPEPWDYTFYVHDIETQVEDLIITTSEPTVDTEYGYAEVDGLKVTFHYPQSMVGQRVLVFLTLSDGTDTAQAMILVNVTSDWVPELVNKLPDVVLEENSTIYNVFDLDDYFIDRDADSLYFSSGYHNIRVDINENNTVDITALEHWTGSEFVTFRAEDPIGAIAEDIITVTVIPVNNPPKISGVPDLVVHYDYSFAFDLSPYISDSDNLTFELIVWTSELWDYIWLQQNNKLGIVVNYPESMNGTTIQVTIYVSDGMEISSQQIQISVTSNFPPELIQNLPDIFFDEDTILWNAFCLSDYFDDIDSHVLYYTNGTKFINATINENLTVDFSAPENWYGFEWVTFRATDPTGALAEDKILVVVVPVNDAPTIASIPRQEKEEGDQWILDLSQYIDDIDNNASELIITIRSEVGHDYVILVGNILIFQYPEGVRDDVISITVSDGELEASRSFIVDIKGSDQVLPTIWDLIPWPWVFLFLISGIGGAFAFYKKKSKYWVYEAFLIHEKGVPMAHVSREERSDLEDVVVGGMFTAVQDFINDAFSGKTADEDWELDEMKFGDNKILIERSHRLFLAVIFEGNGGKLRNLVKKLLGDINKEYGAVLEDWDGDMTKLSGIRPMVAGLISKKARKKPGSERLHAQSQLSAQEEDFEDAMMRWEDPTKMAGKELEEYIERVRGSMPEIVTAQEVEILEIDVSECPVCGKKIEARINKCPRCGVQFTAIEDLLILSSKKLEDRGEKNIQKEGGNHEN